MAVGDETTTANWDEMLQALTDEHRRRLLIALVEHNPLEDVAKVPEGVYVGEKVPDVLQVEMHHQHLPTLEAAGFIKWNREDHEVVKGPKFDEIRPLLELIHAHQDELPEGWM